MPKYKKYGYFVTLAFVMLQNACFAGNTINPAFANLPQDILLGTDIKNISEFKLTGVIVPGEYRAESGGAILQVTVTEKADSFQLTRTLQEPGMPKEIKTYLLKTSKSSLIRTAAVSIATTGNGLLLLETKSDSLGIPADLWVFYLK